jgi:hypothetical protein
MTWFYGLYHVLELLQAGNQKSIRICARMGKCLEEEKDELVGDK